MNEIVLISITLVIFFLFFFWRLRRIEKELKLIVHNIDELHDICHDNHQDLCRIRTMLIKNDIKNGGNYGM